MLLKTEEVSKAKKYICNRTFVLVVKNLLLIQMIQLYSICPSTCCVWCLWHFGDKKGSLLSRSTTLTRFKGNQVVANR